MIPGNVTPKAVTITSQSTDMVTLAANTAGVRSPIATIKAKLGQYLLIPNKTRVKGVVIRGFHFVMKLKNAAGTEISSGAKLFLARQTPSMEAPEYIRRVTYNIWRDLDTATQRNDDYKGGIAQSVDLNREKPIVLEPDHLFILELDAPEVVDWSKSYFEIVAGEVNQ